MHRPHLPLGPPPLPPWEQREPEPVAFASLWVSGPDPSLDGLVRIEALRRGPDGGLERFERWCNPLSEAPDAGVSARLAREFGIEGPELEAAVPAAVAWSEFSAFVGPRALVVADADVFGTWSAHFESSATNRRCVLGLSEFSAQWLPGRSTRSREHLVAELLGAQRMRSAPGAIRAADIQAALGEVVARLRELEPAALRLAASAAMCAARLLREVDEDAARNFELGLGLIERPSRFLADSAELSERFGALSDGGFGLALDDDDARNPGEAAREAIELLEPRWRLGEDERGDTVPVTTEEDKPFDERDLQLVDDVFQVHLPAIFAEQGESLLYRAGQHEVAREVARTLGANELLLVHAPTGTGKTLAYLVPALIWSARHGVRVGVSTYTRALQEQAMDREVPRALQALERAAALSNQRLPCTPRVALLKGRPNYLCWRALKLHVPSAEDGHESWLAWLTLALFSLRDDAGDLDRLGLRASFGVGGRERETKELESLTRQIRAQIGCCQQREDRRSCGADAARQRAEHCHLVLVNHAFALVRQAYFKHVVFDECEHLHEQAHAAWSHTLALEELRQLFARVRQEGRPASRAPLDRLERVVVEETQAASSLAGAITAWREVQSSLDALEREIAAFLTWRTAKERARERRDQHSLLCEFVLHGNSASLIEARTALGLSTQTLSTTLAQLIEGLDAIPMRGIPRLRRQLELLRTEIEEVYAGLEAWMPSSDGSVAYNEHTFYDVELDARGRHVLAARVLLPNEYLGRHYYPELKTAVLLSATTWLRAGFESAKAYLGLDRAASPAPDETRTASSVRCVRAPDPFDYRRVLLALPADAPSYSEQREAWHAYVRRFLAHLGERTRGRMLVLFTNQEELRRFGEELSGFFRARRIPFWYQGMRGIAKEELARLFRARTDSILMGVDTFWYGADFPGETLEYLVIVKLPYGVPDRYHHAQCAALGAGEQRRRIYLPRALAKFRQGFGRLMRRESDRGCVFLLDTRAGKRQHGLFLEELPLGGSLEPEGEWRSEGARVVSDTTDECVQAALAHMDLLEDVRRRGLDTPFAGDSVAPTKPAPKPSIARGGLAALNGFVREMPAPPKREPTPPPTQAIDPDEIPF